MITFIANTLYKENYATHATRKLSQLVDNQTLLRYEWFNKSRWNYLEVRAKNQKNDIVPNSEAEFITEHYWGYARSKENLTMEYEVVHPKWQVQEVVDYKIEADFVDLYGSEFSFLETAKPSSVFLADGSPVSILKGKRIL